MLGVFILLPANFVILLTETSITHETFVSQQIHAHLGSFHHQPTPALLQRTNTENWKLPEKEMRGHSPNVHIHVSVSDLKINTIDLPILLQEICGPILGIYKSLTDT